MRPRTTERTQRVRSLFQRLELIVEQYHSLWQIQPGIHYPSGLVIATLRALVADGENGGSGMAQIGIAAEVQRSPVLVTRLMQEMEAAGFVERDHGKFDHRQRTVRITPKGRSHLEAFEDLKASLGDGIFTHGTAESWQQVDESLEHVAAVLKALSEARRLDRSASASPTSDAVRKDAG